MNETKSRVNAKMSDEMEMFARVSEKHVVQSLSQYFMTPEAKVMPYLKIFSAGNIYSAYYCLQYLYNFIRAQYNTKQVHQIFISTFFIGNNQQLAQLVDLLSSENFIPNVKMGIKSLISRFMGLPSSLAQTLQNKKINIKKLQSNFIQQILSILPNLTEQQQIYVLNKIISAGHAQFLVSVCDDENRVSQILVNNYRQIIKRNTVLKCLCLSIVKEKTIKANDRREILMKQIVERHCDSEIDRQLIVRLFRVIEFGPQHAQILFRLILENNRLLIRAVYEDLMQWWVEGNDHYLNEDFIRFRANLLAIIMKEVKVKEVKEVRKEVRKEMKEVKEVKEEVREVKEEVKEVKEVRKEMKEVKEVKEMREEVKEVKEMKEEMKEFEESSNICQISLGIERRLMNGDGDKSVVNLIWATFAEKYGMTIDGKLSTNLLKSNKREQIVEEESAESVEESVEAQNVEQSAVNLPKEETDENSEQITEMPRNLYDCILGLKNPARKQITLEQLPKIIRRNPQDLVFTWKELIRQLLYNLNKSTSTSLIALFITRPISFIESISCYFFEKDSSLSDKIILIEVLSEGIEQLSTRPKAVEFQQSNQQFYFKKVSSKYYNDKKPKIEEFPQKEMKVRRWGHTRIAHQKSTSSVSLNIIENDPYINRLYQIANSLFFSIISKLILLPIFPKQILITNALLKLLSVLSSHLRNHFEKYKILSEVVEACVLVIAHISNVNRKEKESGSRRNKKEWKETSLGILNVLNKVSMVIDQYIPQLMLANIEKCVVELKKIPEYGVAPIINMIEANVYTNVTGNQVEF